METILKLQACVLVNDYLEELALALYIENFEWTEENLPAGWVFRPLSDFFPVKTGKKNANIASENGQYPFFTCSQQSLSADCYSFEGSAILVAGNGDFNVKWYEGKFEAYQRTYVLMPYDPKLLGLLYCAVKRNLDRITSGSRGSVIKFITKSNIADYSIAVPQEPESHETVVRLNHILKAIDANKRESAILGELRNALLPRLMSGEIDVSKIDLTQLNNHLSLRAIEMSNLNDLLVFEVPVLLREKVETKRKVHSISIRLIDCVLLNPDAFRHPSNTAPSYSGWQAKSGA